MKTRRTPRGALLWLIAGIIAPLVIVGGLLGVMGSASQGLENVPIALVNNDELITETDEFGVETIIFASRPLVTELVTNEDFAVDWVITNSAQANELLAQGDVYAIVEIPKNFSQAVTTLDQATPQQASFTIKTDPSRSYLAGLLGDQIGQALASAVSDEFGKEITSGLFTAVVELGDAFAKTAEGATKLADGTAELADGVGELDTATTELASGYGTFDDGLSDFTDGVSSLSDGLDTFEAETQTLPTLSSSIKTYTDGVSSVATGLSGLNSTGAFSSITGTTGTAVQSLLSALASLGSSSSALASGADTALSGVRTGIIAFDKGADALDEAGQEISDGSGEIRSGVVDLSVGVSELANGVGELAEGTREFSDGVNEGSTEIQDQGFSQPSDKSLDALISPIVFSQQDKSASVGFQETLSSIFVPLGLWLVALVYFLLLPKPPARTLTSTLPTAKILWRSLKPVLAMVALQTIVVTALLHTVAGLDWSSVGWTLPLVLLTALATTGSHFLVWTWRPMWLAPLSITALVLQVVTMGTLIPIEILPSIYQSFASLTPVSWSSDGILAALAGGDTPRVVTDLVLLGGSFLVSVALSFIALRSQRSAAVRRELGLSLSVMRMA